MVPEGDIETGSDDNSDPEINSMLVPASGTSGDVVPDARVKQDTAAEPEPWCILRGGNERSRDQDRFKMPPPAHCSLELAAKLESGRDPLTDPEQQGGSYAPIAPGTPAADALGEPRRAETDFEIGSLPSTQALSVEAGNRYQRHQKEQPTSHRRALSRYTRTCGTSFSSFRMPATPFSVIRAGSKPDGMRTPPSHRPVESNTSKSTGADWSGSVYR